MTNVSQLKEVNITRIFNAPRDVVYDAWTTTDILSKWWGPKGFTNPVCELNLYDGGAIRIDMTGPDGTVYPMGGTFHELVKPSLLVFSTTAFDDAENGSKLEAVNTVSFSEEDGKTSLNLHASVIKAEGDGIEAVNGMEEGWNQSFDRLAELLSS
jgi:uncharacterized protein YndB with AHSA1/START domain